MVKSHARTFDPSRSRGYARKAAISVSCRQSSASCGPTVAARKRASESRCSSSASWKGGSDIYCEVNGPWPVSVRFLLAEQVVDGVGALDGRDVDPAPDERPRH